jgi:hypothetical protein
MEPVFVIGILSSIPIVAIVTNALIKIKKMELEKIDKENHKGDTQIIQLVDVLLKENADLKKRVENVETIVTLGEANTTQYQHLPPQSQEQDIEKLAKNGNEIAKILLERQQIKNKQR